MMTIAKIITNKSNHFNDPHEGEQHQHRAFGGWWETPRIPHAMCGSTLYVCFNNDK